MRALITSDWHLGYPPRYRGHDDDIRFAAEQIVHLSEEVSHVFLLGDILHMAYRIPNRVLIDLKKILDRIAEHARVYLIPGNHDYHIHSIYRLFNSERIRCLDQPETIWINDIKIALIPFVIKNHPAADIARALVRESDVIMCHQCAMKHLEDERFPTTIWLKFRDEFILAVGDKLTFAGHYHIPTHLDNIYYCGCISPLSIDDIEHVHGCWIWNMDSGEVEFREIKNREWHVISSYRDHDHLIEIIRSDPEAVYYIRAYADEIPELRRITRDYRVILSVIADQKANDYEVSDEHERLIRMSDEDLLRMYLQLKGVELDERLLSLHREIAEVRG